MVTMIRENEIRNDSRAEGREENRREVAFSMRRLGMNEDLIAEVLKTDPSLIREWFEEGEKEA